MEYGKVESEWVICLWFFIWETQTLRIATFRRHNWGLMDGQRSCWKQKFWHRCDVWSGYYGRVVGNFDLAGSLSLYALWCVLLTYCYLAENLNHTITNPSPFPHIATLAIIFYQLKLLKIYIQVFLMYIKIYIQAWRNRFHHFKNGSCSCLDYW
jgi:hypothetical protein